MPVDAIGTQLNVQDAAQTQNNTINQDDFIKLFLAQLQFQDPLEPVDNSEFLAQLAQFTAMEQARQTSQNTNNLLVMNASSQAVGLLGKLVDVQGMGQPVTGTVIAVHFTPAGALLNIEKANEEVLVDIRLSQVSLVKNVTN